MLTRETLFLLNALPIAGLDTVGIDYSGALGGGPFKGARGTLVFSIVGVDAVAAGGIKAHGQDHATFSRGIGPTSDDADGEIEWPG